MFGRKRKQVDEDLLEDDLELGEDSPDEDSPDDDGDALEVAPAEVPRKKVAGVTTGPWDLKDVPAGGERVDLGALQVPVPESCELRVDLDANGAVVAATLVHDTSILQLLVFAAPRSEGIWDEVRDEIRVTVLASGGRAYDVEGVYGSELHVAAPTDQPGVLADIRFIGVDGPRWFLRGLLSGPAATTADPVLEGAFAGVVVVRGPDAMPPREPLVLRIPQDAADAIERGEAAVVPNGPMPVPPAPVEDIVSTQPVLEESVASEEVVSEPVTVPETPLEPFTAPEIVDEATDPVVPEAVALAAFAAEQEAEVVPEPVVPEPFVPEPFVPEPFEPEPVEPEPIVPEPMAEAVPVPEPVVEPVPEPETVAEVSDSALPPEPAEPLETAEEPPLAVVGPTETPVPDLSAPHGAPVAEPAAVVPEPVDTPAPAPAATEPEPPAVTPEAIAAAVTAHQVAEAPDEELLPASAGQPVLDAAPLPVAPSSVDVDGDEELLPASAGQPVLASEPVPEPVTPSPVAAGPTVVGGPTETPVPDLSADETQPVVIEPPAVAAAPAAAAPDEDDDDEIQFSAFPSAIPPKKR